MAGILKQLHRESFTDSSVVVVTHNSNRSLLQVKVIIDGVSSSSAIEKVERDLIDPLNKLTVYLDAAYTGIVQILENDTVSSPAFGVSEEKNALSHSFGSNLFIAESLEVSSSTFETFTDKVVLTTTEDALGKYRIGWSYSWNFDSTLYDFSAQLILVGGGAGGTDLVLMEHFQEPKDNSGAYLTTGTDQKHLASGFRYIDFSIEEAHTFKLQWRTSQGGNEASIWNATLELWRVSS